MPHINPELMFFILVSTLPAAIIYRASEIRTVNLASLLIAVGCVFLSLSWSVDFSLHTLVARGLIRPADFTMPHILLVLFGFVPGAALVGFGFASWARETTTLRFEVSRRRDAEAELERVNARLVQEVERAARADKAKNDFLANMSHDLRTPLNAIMGFSEIMESEMLGKLGTARYKEYLAAINSSSKQLHDSISDILDLAKISSGQMVLRRQKFHLNDLVRECLALVQAEAAEKAITLESNFATEVLVDADRRMLLQVVLSLLTNAIKYTPMHGKVSFAILQQMDGRPVLVIRDTGYGISNQDIKLAMQPFEHAESLLARSHEGLALQLALVKQFVELHEGQLMIDSKKDYGTCVTIKLPAVPSSSSFGVEQAASVA